MKEPNEPQQAYLDTAIRKSPSRKCRCGAVVQPRSAHGLMEGSGNSYSTSVGYHCPSCGRHFRVGLLGDAIGCIILGAIVGRVGLESLFFGLFLVPLALFLFAAAIIKIRSRILYPAIKPAPRA